MARLTDAIRRWFVTRMTDEPFPEPPAPGKDPAADREVTEDVDENPLDDEPLVDRVLAIGTPDDRSRSFYAGQLRAIYPRSGDSVCQLLDRVVRPIDSQAYIECDDETGL